jgi:sulfur carrier protein ThiS
MKPMPFDMEFDTETIDANARGDKPTGETTAADLLELRSQLSEEIAMAINDGNVKEMLWLDEKIKSLEPRIFAAKLETLKQMLELNAERKAEVLTEIDGLRQLRQDLNRKLVRAMDLHRLRGERVVRAEFLLQVAESNLESIRVSDRELKQKSEQIKENKLNEVKRYETEFRTNFH